MSLADKIAHISRLPLFSEMKPDEIEHIAELFEGGYFCRAGQHGNLAQRQWGARHLGAGG